MSNSKSNDGPFPWRVHPIWRGIGCAFLIIIPLMSLGLVEMALPLLEEPLPDFLADSRVLPLLGEVDAFWGRIFIAAVISIALFLLLTVLGSFFYSMMGGKRQEDKAKLIKKDKYRFRS